MANKSLFNTQKTGRQNVVNRAGGEAYALTDKEALAQYACTGTFGNTFYASADEQLQEVLALAQKLPSKFVAQTAVYAREQGKMKDSPCLLLAVLAARGELALIRQIFPLVVTNFKQLSTFMQMVRSGVTGRKSFGSAIKNMINAWLNGMDPTTLFYSQVGVGNPSIADVIKMTHPNPITTQHKALYAYFIGRDYNFSDLPQLVQDFENYKRAAPAERVLMETPKVPFQCLASLDLTTAQWRDIAMNGGWNMVRMNINTFQRHGALDQEVEQSLAAKISNPDLVRRFNAFPYQLMTSWKYTQGVSMVLSEALQDAMEVATENVPALNKSVIIAVDCSGSMNCPVTNKSGAPSVVTCNEVASLMAAVVLRQNKYATVYRFDTNANELRLNPRDSVMTNANQIGFHGGGTDCASGLRLANQKGVKADVFIIVSDNESWAHYSRLTDKEWAIFKKRNPNAKLIQIDLAANGYSNAPTASDVLNVGSFSDAVWQVIADFVDGKKDAWIQRIETTNVE